MTHAAIILLLAQLADILLTALGISRGALEVNPFRFGWQMIGAKILLVVAVAHLLNVFASRLRWLVWVPTSISILVVLWNILMLRML